VKAFDLHVVPRPFDCLAGAQDKRCVASAGAQSPFTRERGEASTHRARLDPGLRRGTEMPKCDYFDETLTHLAGVHSER
jgi:hypothetical protein